MNNSILFLTENIHYSEKLKNQSNENYRYYVALAQEKISKIY